jgi:cytochrome c1
LVNPSAAFLQDKYNIDLDLAKLFNNGKVDVKYVLDGAAFIQEIFQKDLDYVQKFPLTNKFVNNLVQQGTKIITVTHLAYLGASIYLVAVVLTSYCYLIHSRKQLALAQSLDKKLNLITEEEVVPILQYFETLLSSDDKNGMKNVCDAKIDWMKMLNDTILKIQNILGEIKELRSQAIEGEEQTRILQYGTAAVGAVGTLILAAPLAPLALGVGIASLVGCVQFERSKLNYEKTNSLYDEKEDKAMAAQKALTRLRTIVKIACLHGFNKLENDYQWNAIAGGG